MAPVLAYVRDRVEAPVLPWQQPLNKLFPKGFTSRLNTVYLQVEAPRIVRKQLHDEALAQHLQHSYQHGWDDCCEIPAQTERYTTHNKILPTSPLADPWHELLHTMRSNGRLLSHHLPVVPGTVTTPINTAAKIKLYQPDQVKWRPSLDGRYPRGDFASLGDWCKPENRQSTTTNLYELVGDILHVRAASATIVDYKSFYTTLARRIDQVGRNCVFFHLKGDSQPQFHYMLDDAFGTVTAPHKGECHATALQLLQLEEIYTLTGIHVTAHRRVDDTIFLLPAGMTKRNKDHVLHGYHTVCQRASQPVSHAKTEHDKVEFVFDGFRHVLNYLGEVHVAATHPGAVGVCPERRAKMTVDLKYIIANRATRKDAEKFCGVVEWASMAVPFMRALIVEFRKTWTVLKFDNAKCKPGRSVSYLNQLLDLLAKPLYTPYSHLFCLEEPTLNFTTDASGVDCIGGYVGLPSKFGKTGADWFFHQRLHKAHVLQTTTGAVHEFNTMFLELMGLYYVLMVAESTAWNQAVRWWTDSLSAVIVWKKQCSTHVPTNRLIILIARYCATHHILVLATHVLREDNKTADILTHAHTSLFCATQGSKLTNKRNVPDMAVRKTKNITYPSTDPTLHSKE